MLSSLEINSNCYLYESRDLDRSQKEEKYLRNIAFEKVFLGTENVLERWIGIHCKSSFDRITFEHFLVGKYT